MFADMEEGDLLQFRGGLGNKEVAGIKKEEGKYYRRDFEGEWYEFDPYKRLSEMAISSIKAAEEVKKNKPKLYKLFTRIFN